MSSLAADGVYLLPKSPVGAVGFYPTRFTLTLAGGIVSVALSLGLGNPVFSRGNKITYSWLPLATVIALCCPDFPPLRAAVQQSDFANIAQIG